MHARAPNPARSLSRGDRAKCTLAPQIQHESFFSCLHLAERSDKTHGRALRQSGIQPCVRSRFARRSGKMHARAPNPRTRQICGAARFLFHLLGVEPSPATLACGAIKLNGLNNCGEFSAQCPLRRAGRTKKHTHIQAITVIKIAATALLPFCSSCARAVGHRLSTTARPSDLFSSSVELNTRSAMERRLLREGSRE